MRALLHALPLTALVVCVFPVCATPARAEAVCPDRAFRRTQEYRGVGYPIAAIVVEDLDHDGRADFVGLTSGSTRRLVVMRNLGLDPDGILRWGAPALTPLASTATEIIGGDFDGDGSPDVAVAIATTNRLAVHRGNGTGGFFPPVETVCSRTPTGLVAGDFGNDGRTEIVSIWGTGAFAVFNWDGTRLAPQPADSIGVLSGIGQIVLADENSDGRLDVVSLYGSSSFSFKLGTGTGANGGPTFAPALKLAPSVYPGVSGSVSEFTLADVSGEGVPDLVGRGFYANTYGPPYVSGPAFFESEAVSASGVWQGGFATLWTSYQSGLSRVSSGPLSPGGPAEVFFTDATAMYNWAPWGARDFLRATTSGCGKVALADLDGDGRTDVLAPFNDGTGLTWALRGCAPHPDLPASPHPAGDWGAGGIELNDGTGPSLAPSACADGAGGVYVAWQHDRGAGAWDVRVQRFTPAGTPPSGWPAAGLAVAAPAETIRTSPALVPDGAGGVFVAWSQSDGAPRLQHILPQGARDPSWSEAGLRVPPDLGPSAPRTQSWGVAPDDSGGVLVMGMAGLNSNATCWADRVRPDGTRAAGWPAGGLIVRSSTSGGGSSNLVRSVKFVTGLNSAICAQVEVESICYEGTSGCFPPYDWTNYFLDAVRSSGQHYEEILDGSLAGVWSDGHGAALTWRASKSIHRATFGGPGSWVRDATVEPLAGGALAVDPTLGINIIAIEYDDAAPVGAHRLYLTRFGPDGVSPAGWPANGRRLTWSEAGAQVGPEIVIGSDGSRMIFDLDSRSGTRGLYVMKVDANGYPWPGWDFGGQPVVENLVAETIPRGVAGNDGSAYVVWSDSRSGRPSVYVQRVGSDLPVPVTFTALEPRASANEVQLDWYVSEPSAAGYDVERSAAGEWRTIAHAGADGSGHVRITDREVAPGRTYGYRLRSDEGTSSAVWVSVPSPSTIALRAIDAPRSRGSVRLLATLGSGGPAKLEWFDVLGRRLGSLTLTLEAGVATEVVLGGREALPPGLVLARLSSGSHVARARTFVIR